MKIQLFHELGFMKLDGSCGNLEPEGDVFGRSALSQQLQYFTLAKGECLSLLGLSCPQHKQDIQQIFGDQGRDVGVPGPHRPYRLF